MNDVNYVCIKGCDTTEILEYLHFEVELPYVYLTNYLTMQLDEP